MFEKQMFEKKATLNIIKCWLKVANNVVYLTNHDNVTNIVNNNKSLYCIDHVSNTTVAFKHKLNSLLLQNCSNVEVRLEGVVNKIVMTNCNNIALSLCKKPVPTIVTYNSIGSIDDITYPLMMTLHSSKVLLANKLYNAHGTEQYFII